SGRRRHPRFSRDWSSDVCSSDLGVERWKAQPCWKEPAPPGTAWRRLSEERPPDRVRIMFWTPPSDDRQRESVTMRTIAMETPQRSEERRVGREGPARTEPHTRTA